MFFRLKAVLFTALICASISFNAKTIERIKKYHSDITIHKDGKIDVTETITVWAEGNRIINGITREFPTIYESELFFKTVIPFEVKKILRDGKSLPTDDITSIQGGKRVYLRGGGKLHVPAMYTFTLDYTTNRQIGFFENHDELYWNVVGADWVFPIDNVTATVHLPNKVDASDVKMTAYAGSLNSKNTAFESEVVDKHTINFRCTQSLYAYEAFSIVLVMPKGSITPPTEWQQWKWFLIDNSDVFIFCLFIFLLFVYLFTHYLSIQRNTPPSKVIPLFNAPEGFTPGMVNYFVQRNFLPTALSADIIQMAVSGWVTIDYQKGGWFSKDKYTLKRTEMHCSDSYYNLILSKLFGNKKSGSITLDSKVQKIIKSVVECQKNKYKKLIDDLFFDSHGWVLFKAFLMGFIGFCFIFLIPHSQVGLKFFYFFISVFSIPISAALFQSYTQKGFTIKDQIEGFKLYLSTAEKGRLKYASTPPVKTPELYEKFLPYAIALGVEEQWARQFTPVFETLIKEGKPYTCRWYHGRGGFRAGRFSSHSAYGFNSAIGSSLASSIGASAPGSSSGFGRGGAGGGGGGGGGGGC